MADQKEVIQQVKDLKRINFVHADLSSIKPDDSPAAAPLRRRIFEGLKANEIRGIISLRNKVAISFIVLLFIQNIATFAVIIIATYTNQLANLQLIFAALVGATLAETYGAIRSIVTWLYKEIKFSIDKE